MDDESGKAVKEHAVGLRWLIAAVRAVWLLVAVVLVIAAGLYCFWQVFVVGLIQNAMLVVPLLGLGLVGALLVAVLLHELGHVLGAIGMRLQILGVKLGPLLLVREGSVWRLRWAPRSDRYLAYVAAAPPSNQKTLARLAGFAATGPVASFLTALGFLLLAVANRSPLPPDVFPSFKGPWWALLLPANSLTALFHIAFAINLLFVLLNAVPYRFEGETSDGAIVLACLRRETGLLRIQAVAILSRVMQGGVRPRDWDAALVAQLAGDEDGSAAEARVALYAYYHAIDCGQIEEARRWLSRATFGRGEPGAPRNGIDIEVAYFVGFHVGDPVKARFSLQRVDRSQVEDHTWLRREAAVLGAEGKTAEALAYVEAALAAVPRSRDPGGSLAEKDWLEEMRQRYRSPA